MNDQISTENRPDPRVELERLVKCFARYLDAEFGPGIENESDEDFEKRCADKDFMSKIYGENRRYGFAQAAKKSRIELFLKLIHDGI